MNFNKLPKFPHCSYCVNVGMENLGKKIKEHIEVDHLEMNPDFQRGHVWTQEQQESYIEYLLREPSTDAGRHIYFNHPGWGRSYSGTMVCVDGLQRVTAITEFVNDKVKAFGHYYSEFEGRIRLGSSVYFNVNNLQTRAEVLEWYIALNAGGTPHSTEDIDRVRALLEKEKKQ